MDKAIMEGLDASLVTKDGMDKDKAATDSMDMDAIFLSEIVTED